MADTPDLVQCPYDPIHFLERHRMPGHIVRCKKNYKGPPLEICMFNAMHLVKKEDMALHFQSCPDALIALRDRERERPSENYQESLATRSNANTTRSLNQSMNSAATNSSHTRGRRQ